MSEPKNESQNPAQVDPAKLPPPPITAEAPKRVKMVKVKVLRPFRIFSGTEQEKICDSIGSIVSVPVTDLPWLTQSSKGQAQGFGERLNEELAYHDMAKAVVVEGSVAA